MPTTPYTSVSAILTLQCATCGFYQKTTNPAIASLLAAKHQAGWGSAHVVTTTGASFLDFTTGTLPPGVTFTRASTGTYNNSSNILATAGVNVARFNYVAGVANLLIEPSATNLLLGSNDFSITYWAPNTCTITAAQFTGPDGINSGWVQANTALNGYMSQTFVYSNIPYTASIWAKRISGTADFQFYLSNIFLAITLTATLTRISATLTPSPAGSGPTLLFDLGASGASNGIFGVQLETGSKMTSYIPTTTAAVTRAIDQATFTIPAGVTQLKYTFDDNSTQTVSVSPGSYTIPATLNRANIKTIDTISGSASINFDFTGGVLPGAITFTRASIGTYNSSGNLLITATNDVARFNYVAGVANLLIEGSATNLLVQSNAFTTAPWIRTQASIATAAQFVSPDGTNNGWSVSSSTAAGNRGGCADRVDFSNIPYTMSIWAKNITGTAPTKYQLYTVVSSSLPTSTTLTRLFATMTPPAIAGQYANFLVDDISGTGSAIVNGYYGAQLETGSVMSSYIPTGATTVTRAADSATFTIPTGINQLVYTFDDNSTQTVAVSPGSYTIPTTLNRPNIKSVVGRYAFDFTGGSLPAGMTFTRPSIGTYVNAGGTLITAGNDVARFNYVAGVANLLIEGSATNLALQSNNFSTAPWSAYNGSVLTASQFTSPDGTNNGWAFTSGGNFGGLLQPANYSNTAYTTSVWAKFIVGTSPILVQIGGTNYTIAATTSTLTRLSVTATAAAGNANALVGVTGTTATDKDGIYGFQLETGSVMTSYIPTTTTAVTRAADSATFTIPAGIGHLTYTFDDNSTQLVTVSAGSYTVPTTLNRPNIKSIVGSA